jgi:glycosyltransferase involved in cell wall biosynthesis
MKVGIVSQYWYDRGGTEVLARNLAAALVRLGFETELLYLDVADRSAVSRPGMPGTVLPAREWSAALRALDEWGAQEVVCLLDLRNRLTEPISRAPSRARRTIYVNINNAEGATLRAAPPLASQLRETIRRFDRVAVFFEGSVAAQVLREWGVPYHVAGTGIPPVAAPVAGGFRARHGLGAGEVVLLCVGLIAPLKFQVEMLQWLPPREGQRLVFIGDVYTGTADYARAFGDALRPRSDCLWLDGIPRDDVLSAMAASDYLLFPSQSEGAPLVLLEAMAMGLVWITTPAIDFARELEGGVIIPLQGFQAAVDALRSAPAYCEGLVHAGRAAQATRWNLDATASTFAAWFTADGEAGGSAVRSSAAPVVLDAPWGTVVDGDVLGATATTPGSGEWLVLADGRAPLTPHALAHLPTVMTTEHDAVILFRAAEPVSPDDASIRAWMGSGVGVFAIRRSWWQQHRAQAPVGRQPTAMWQGAMVAWLTASARCHLGSIVR